MSPASTTKSIVRVAAFSLATAGLISGCSMKSKRADSGSGSSAASARIAELSETRPDARSQFRLPPFQEKRLDNGLTILYLPDQALPYVSYSMVVRTGAAEDPSNLSGLSAMVAELLDKGTTKRKATQIAAELGQIAAEFDATASDDYTLVTASTISTQAEPLLTNLYEIVTEPTFSDAEIERLRQQMLSSIQRMEDSPEAFSAMAFNEFLYGTHPYAHPVSGDVKSIKAIKKKNIIQHYLKYYRPNNSYLAVVGNLTPDLQAKIEKQFGAWQAREVAPPKLPDPAPVKGIQMELVDKPGLVQAQVRLGSIGIARGTPDFLAVRMANTILGGAFSSRLVDRVRRELGLTYNIQSYFDARLVPGPFEISTFTKNVSVGQTVSETMAVLTKFREQGVTDAEVKMAKGYLKGVFPQAIETKERLAMNLMLLRFYGIPDTYLTNYLNDIEKLSTSDVNNAIRAHIDEKNIKILVYSSASEVRSQLEPLAKSWNTEIIQKKSTELQ